MFRKRDARGSSESFKEAFRTLRELELHLKFLNLVYADVLWVFKLVLLSFTILCGFSSIRIIHRNPILGSLYVSLNLGAPIIYIGIFQFAYKITEKVDKLLSIMELKSTTLGSLTEKKYWARVLRSIPRTGIKVGGFGQVEREAVPIFIDFSVKQIVTILITLKRVT